MLGLGQITCKGLNRALALPGTLISKFGKPDEIYAPDPTGKSHDLGGTFDYVRPLATIEPTAIRLGMPVNCGYRFDHIKELEAELLSPQHAGKLIFIAWEQCISTKWLKSFCSARAVILTKYLIGPGTNMIGFIFTHSGRKRPVTFAQDHETQ